MWGRGRGRLDPLRGAVRWWRIVSCYGRRQPPPVGVALQRLPKDGTQQARPIGSPPGGGALTRLCALESTLVRTRRLCRANVSTWAWADARPIRRPSGGRCAFFAALRRPSRFNPPTLSRTMRCTSSRQLVQTMGPPIRSNPTADKDEALRAWASAGKLRARLPGAPAPGSRNALRATPPSPRVGRRSQAPRAPARGPSPWQPRALRAPFPSPR